MMFNVQAYALELLMFHNKYCGYCNKFIKEVALEYNIESLPLKIIDAYNQPGWFKLAKEEGRVQPIIGTPTFIIFDETKLEGIFIVSCVKVIHCPSSRFIAYIIFLSDYNYKKL